MKKFLRYFTVGMVFSIGILVSGCEKNYIQYTDLDVSRLFSPTELEARVINKTSVRLTWKEVKKAQSYSVELFDNPDEDFSGSPDATVSDIAFDQVPYVISGLKGETSYSVRVKAVGADIADSKWISTTFETDPEQLFLPVDVADIESSSVTLHWIPGEVVTQIMLNPGGITHDITAEEADQGVATIEGLTGETEYTAQILNNTIVRGTVTFTSLIDVGGAILVTPDDDLVVVIESAGDGDVLALLPGTYEYGDITIEKSITIRGARPSERPLLLGATIRVKPSVTLSLIDLIMDGTGSNGNQTILYTDDGTNGDLIVTGNEIFNYSKGFLYVSKATNIPSATITNNIIYNIECNGGDFIDFRNGIANEFEFTNNTVYNSALARDLFRMDAGGSTNYPGIHSVININNNTFNSICDGDNRRLLYVRLADHEINFNKNIITNSQGIFSNQGATTINQRSNNDYFNAPNYYNSSDAAKNHDDTGTFTTLDPGFASPSSGDFTVGNEDLKLNGIGDARWIR